MKIKKYVAPSMREAMHRIKKEMGSDAVIIDSKKVKKKGPLGFFTPRDIEVTVALDGSPRKDFSAARKEMVMNRSMAGEIQELKSLVQQIVTRRDSPEKEEGANNTLLQKFYQRLVDNDIDSRIALEITDEIGKEFPQEDLEEDKIDRVIRDKIARHIKSVEYGGQGQVFCFVGPTGVGKTTTLAKMAASFGVFKKKQVGLITIDTYRIGAVEQLKTYSHLMGLPLEVVMSPQELEEAVERMKHLDLIMIDTAGRSSKNSYQLGELEGFMKVLPQAVTFLVLSVTTKGKDLITIAENFKPANYHSFIFTKLDETDAYGNIFNTLYHTSTPVAYLATGQKVPEDLMLAREEHMINLIMGADGK